MDPAEAIVAAAEAELHRGEPLSAYNTTQSGLERFPAHARLRQLQALSLARGGDTVRANAMLRELAEQGHDDAETLGMLARTHKDLALRATNAKFERRFAYIEHALEAQGRTLEEASLEEMDALWNEAKTSEKSSASRPSQPVRG